jgi:phosphoglycolate phosphatase-like HAD superfamily hydrolase
MHFKLLVYDLDGTLFETLPDLCTAVNLSLAAHDHPQKSLDEVRKAIGDGARILIARLVRPGSSDVEIDAVWETFRVEYLKVCADSSFLLPGVEEFLESRRQDSPGRFQAILTNKPQAPSDALARRFKMDRWIGRVVGGDTPLGKKPETGGLLDLMAWASATPEQTLMIGDGPADLAVAQNAGVKCVLVEGGYGNSQELEGRPWAWKVANFAELAALWGEIEPRNG